MFCPWRPTKTPECSVTSSETPWAKFCPCPTTLSPPFRTLEEILHKLVQVIQEDDCSLQSLSVAESRLKARTCILVNALGSNACLAKVDLSGNLMEDMGAKMLAKALQINSTLRSLSWDRNNTTAVGFQDIARAMERHPNFPPEDPMVPPTQWPRSQGATRTGAPAAAGHCHQHGRASNLSPRAWGTWGQPWGRCGK
uniref:Leucine rich repeat containing 45 n=1 Tax=Gallus gallus TaxID=9031 RepID=A0A8V0XH41_CHICK